MAGMDQILRLRVPARLGLAVRREANRRMISQAALVRQALVEYLEIPGQKDGTNDPRRSQVRF